jgi:glycosyltransferase involved in cell wall biosynthesis
VTIGLAIREILKAYRGDIILADGGSSDDTWKTARTAGARVADAGCGCDRACALGAETA